MGYLSININQNLLIKIITFINRIVSGNLKSLLDKISKDFGNEIKHIAEGKILEYQVEEYKRNHNEGN